MRSLFAVGFLRSIDATAATCQEYYDSLSFQSVTARRWCEEGSYFDFNSTRNGRAVKVFYRCSGDSQKPSIVMGHGWPSSSYDFQDLVALLDTDYHVCTVDYVGHGFSEKPSDKGYSYSLFEHADVIEHLVTEVVPLDAFTYLTHDEGDSVGFIFLSRYEEAKKPYTIQHHIFMNGGIYLPLTQLSTFQTRLLSNVTGPAFQMLLNGAILAHGVGTDGNPVLDKAQEKELATVFDYQHGPHILHKTIQYLEERRLHEDEWLEALGRSPVDSTMIWGKADPVCVTAVGEYVWQNFLENRSSAPAALHWLETASHYPQWGSHEEIARIVRSALQEQSVVV